MVGAVGLDINTVTAGLDTDAYLGLLRLYGALVHAHFSAEPGSFHVMTLGAERRIVHAGPGSLRPRRVR